MSLARPLVVLPVLSVLGCANSHAPDCMDGGTTVERWSCNVARCAGDCCTDPDSGERYCCSYDNRTYLTEGPRCGDGPPCINQFVCCAWLDETCPGAAAIIPRCYDGVNADQCGSSYYESTHDYCHDLLLEAARRSR